MSKEEESRPYRIIIRIVRYSELGKPTVDWPIVFAGNAVQVHLWANRQGLKWVPDENVFGGYWNNETGDSYLPE